MLTIYGRATSSNVQLVMWAVGELGLEHSRLDYGHVHGGTDTPEFRAMNPRGRVPVLKDGDLIVWESCAILRYLAAQYGGGGAFWPADPAKRAGVDMWAEFGKNEMAQGFTGPIFWPRVRTAAKDRNEGALRDAIGPQPGYRRNQLSQRPGRCAAKTARRTDRRTRKTAVPESRKPLRRRPFRWFWQRCGWR